MRGQSTKGFNVNAGYCVLGFMVCRNGARLKVAEQTFEKLKDRVRELTRRTRGIRLGTLVAE